MKVDANKYNEFRDILKNIFYRGWAFELHLEDGDFYLQLDLKEDGWKGRKWRMSPHMTRSEVVQTAFLAVKTAEEHEMREKFTYFGKAIFGPHLNADDLVEFIGTAVRLDERLPGRGYEHKSGAY